MTRIREWLLFGIQFIVKMGLLGKYQLISTATPEPDNKRGLKTLEKTILSLGKKNDSLSVRLTEVQQKLDYITSRYTDAEKKVSDFLLENVSSQKEIALLNSTLEQATILSERLQGEMKKWRT